MRSFVPLIFAFFIALIAASSGPSALADMASDCGNGMTAPDERIAACSEVIRNNARASWAYVNRGNAYRAKGDHDRAIAGATTAIEIDPRLAQAYALRGVA